MFGLGKTKITLKITGMDCEHCVHHVKTALENLDGVEKADVSLKEGRAVAILEKDKTVEADVMIRAVKEAGYEASV